MLISPEHRNGRQERTIFCLRQLALIVIPDFLHCHFPDRSALKENEGHGTGAIFNAGCSQC
jgi:hypothetical protein